MELFLHNIYNIFVEVKIFILICLRFIKNCDCGVKILMFDAKEYILKNGLKLITVKRDTEIAAVHAGIKVGSLYEDQNEKGISHFIEHMLFKGTKDMNNEELNSCLENLGGEYNAYTDYNCTVLGITALVEEMEDSIKLMSDMLMNSTFPEDELEKERNVILAEIRTSKDDVEDYSFDRINDIAFEKSPLKYGTIGEEASVKSFTREQIVGFYNKYYIPDNCYISVVSNYEHEYVKKLIEKYYEIWKWKELKTVEIIKEKNKNIKVISHKKEIEQSTIIYLYTFYGITEDSELALKILNHKLGESSNSILFRELREQRGLAYDVYTHLDLTNDVKTLYIYTAVSPENVDQALAVIDGTIEKIKNEEIVFDESTIDLMKKVLKTAVALTLEDSTDIGNYILHQSIDGESIYKLFDDMKEMKLIRKDDIYKAAKDVLKCPAVHILLPEGK